MLLQFQQRLRDALTRAVEPVLTGSELRPQVMLERPKVAAHGDAATNLAMQIAKPLKRNPREVADTLCASLLADAQLKDLLQSAEVAGPDSST